MKLRLSAMITLVTALNCFACGDASEDNTSSKRDAAKAGSKAKPEETAGSGAAGAGAGAAPIKCGTTTCASMGSGILASFIMPCCVDEAASKCGMSSPLGGGCMEPAKSDDRCPSVDVMGIIQLPSCCSETDRCGINAAMFGMEGCIDLKDASKQIPAMGFITFPAPRTCSGVIDEPEPKDEADAGI